VSGLARECAGPVTESQAPPAKPELVLGRVDPVGSPSDAPTPPTPPTPPPALVPHVVVRLALPEATHAKLRHALALLAHAVPGGDLAQVVDRALDALIAQLERRKIAATARPRKPRAQEPARTPNAARTIPAHVRRAVWQRDEGRCAFVSKQGRRCSARALLEFDHMDPVARGGTARAERM